MFCDAFLLGWYHIITCFYRIHNSLNFNHNHKIVNEIDFVDKATGTNVLKRLMIYTQDIPMQTANSNKAECLKAPYEHMFLLIYWVLISSKKVDSMFKQSIFSSLQNLHTERL